MAKKSAPKKSAPKKSAIKKAAPAKVASKKPAPKATPSDLNDRAHLVAVLQAATGCTATAARDALSDVLGTISASLKKNGKVQFVGFGTFTVTKRAARAGINPKTGEKIKIKASKSVRFKPGAALKGSL
ncbi:HU family DNA-binding protein [Thalassospiraceae bacterium LMO-SO8]|nr:HU family DNA-binding protein [Thalassospiraceae bacterium LMO-SO8]|tara:strand:- start:124 stop:510 length:387 start_codon:yes stop_codon:yes gene_type:complete